MIEEIKETIKRSYNINNLYLEPNNYRFVKNYNKIVRVGSLKKIDIWRLTNEI
jgi:hypothetical protein